MPFVKELPVWNALGVSPSTEAKTNGWGPNQHPPADWFNWIQNKTYESLQELQQNAVHKDDPIAVADGSTTTKGILMLEDSTTSTNTTNAATPNSVKQVADLVTQHKEERVDLGEVHGLRVTDGKLEFYDGTVWQKVKGDGFPVGNVSTLSVKKGNAVASLKWTDPQDTTITDSNSQVITIAKWIGTKVVYKAGAYPTNENDGTIALDSKIRNAYQTTAFDVTGLTNGVEYFFMLFPYTEDVVTIDAANRISAIPSASDDTSGSPGPSNLVGGVMQAGYFGTVTSTELITGDALASAAGLSAGTTQNSTTDWLKFAHEDKILFVAKKPIRHSITWDAIHAAGCAYGSKTVVIGGLTYKVRLFRSALTDPALDANADKGAIGSEWNKLMLPIHVEAPSSWAYPVYCGTTEDWGINFTDADLWTISSAGNGTYTWCQEKLTSNAAGRVIRGGGGVSYWSTYTSSNTNANYGWRPVLELL